MPTPIDRDLLQRLLADQQAQLIEVLPAAEYVFATDPERYLAQIRDVVVCPACLAEKPVA
jgi:hypothetical protein